MRNPFWLMPLWLMPLPLLTTTSVRAANHIVGIGDECSNAAICFYPSPLAIQVGDTVRFYVYNGNFFTGPHNVVADDGSFRCAQGCDGEGGDGSPRDFPQWSFTRTFNAPGIVAYHDDVSRAKGVLVVQEPTAPVQLQTAYEYAFRSQSAHVSSYFVTSNADEIASLGRGPLGWVPTLETFLVWSGPASGAIATCRLVDSAFGGHVYTPYAAECGALQAQERWVYEGIAFYLQVPDENGNCPPDTTVLFRLYNQSKYAPPYSADTFAAGAPLHRYTTSTVTFNQMRAAGWEFEGDSKTFAFACVPF